MQRNKRALAPWQTRWVALHDDLHLLEVLLDAIHAGPDYLKEYWALSADVLSFSQDLEEAYELEMARDGQGGGDEVFLRLRGRVMHMQARAQLLTLENEVD